MNKWLPTIITIALGGLAAVTPDVQKAIAAHPAIGVVFGAAYAILKGLLPSPIQN